MDREPARFGTPELRRLLKRHYLECDKVFQKWRRRGHHYPPPQLPPFPEDCRGMMCRPGGDPGWVQR